MGSRGENKPYNIVDVCVHTFAMSAQTFIAGGGPYYRLTGAAPTAPGQALLSSADGVASWGSVPGADWLSESVAVAEMVGTGIGSDVGTALISYSVSSVKVDGQDASLFSGSFQEPGPFELSTGATGLRFTVPGGAVPIGALGVGGSYSANLQEPPGQNFTQTAQVWSQETMPFLSNSPKSQTRAAGQRSP